MNPYLAIATEYVNNEIGTDFAIVPESIRDLEDVFCFTFQTKAFLETGDFSAMTVGQGYNFILKKDNRHFSYGSGFSFEEALDDLRKKIAMEARIKAFKADFELDSAYSIQIHQIRKKQLVVDVLLKHHLQYVIPEVVGDSIFRISRKYKATDILTRLNDLPVTFNLIPSNTLIYLIDELLKLNVCTFELIPYVHQQREVYSSRATPEDLAPIW